MDVFLLYKTILHRVSYMFHIYINKQKDYREVTEDELIRRYPHGKQGFLTVYAIPLPRNILYI